jgi:hypothetical protein
MTAVFHANIPDLADSGLMGYYWTLPNASLFLSSAPDAPPGVSINDLTPETSGLLAGMFMAPSDSDFNKTTSALEQALRDLATSQPDAIHVSSSTIPPQDFLTLWQATAPQTVGSTGSRLGSWLLGREGLTSHSIPTLSKALAAASDNSIWPQLGHVVAGPNVWNPPGGIPGGGNAVLPAWRKAYTHLVLPASWDGADQKEAEMTKERLRSVRVQALRDLQPGSGSYSNEADPTVEGWKKEFWGENYERLLEVKRKWDPEGVFWCRACVGSDEWEWALRVQGGDGVGQEVGRLCRA